MNRCPITYDLCEDTQYSTSGLKKIHRNLHYLQTFPYDIQEQIREATVRAGKISIQGVQPKLSICLNIKKQSFEIVDKHGLYILKPQNQLYPQMPENEDLTMRLAAIAGINVPFHGQIYCKDNSLSYFIRRFDRPNLKRKLQTEDFAQAAGVDRENKYRYSLEKIVPLLDYCTYPIIERSKFYFLTLFSFLVGNEDMHLKNFSFIRANGKIQLSPAYDLLNSTIILQQMGKASADIEELALPLAGKKRKLTKSILVNYFGKERLELNEQLIEKQLNIFQKCYPQWLKLIDISFLSQEGKLLYKNLLSERFKRLTS